MSMVGLTPSLGDKTFIIQVSEVVYRHRSNMEPRSPTEKNNSDKLHIYLFTYITIDLPKIWLLTALMYFLCPKSGKLCSCVAFQV